MALQTAARQPPRTAQRGLAAEGAPGTGAWLGQAAVLPAAKRQWAQVTMAHAGALPAAAEQPPQTAWHGQPAEPAPSAWGWSSQAVFPAEAQGQ
eukprot:3249891-Pyramimonas_sp.AAC.1